MGFILLLKSLSALEYSIFIHHDIKSMICLSDIYFKDLSILYYITCFIAKVKIAFVTTCNFKALVGYLLLLFLINTTSKLPDSQLLGGKLLSMLRASSSIS